jgi:hypothetical protein
MANFCPKCGEKSGPENKFCNNCGASLAVSAGTPQQAAQPASQPASAQANSVRPKPLAIQIIGACLQILVWGLLLYWIWYSYGCAVGKYPGTGDQACQWFYSTFSGKNGGDENNNKDGTVCIPTGCGNLWRCNGTYYLEEKQKRVDACFTLGNRPDKIYSSWSGTCRQCP